ASTAATPGRSSNLHGEVAARFAIPAALRSSREDIVRTLRELGRALTAREIADRLQLGTGERRGLHRQLKALVDRGMLERARGGRYAVSGRDAVEGVVLFRSSGTAELLADAGETYKIPPPFLRGTLPGDRVRAEVLPERGGRPAVRVAELLEPGAGQLLGTFRRAGRGGYVEPREPDLFPYY